ncbi:sensor histidine kinase [Sphingomonas sp. NPDC079357]|uniref:sensor histidine kinase n=1 Tax=Sphingomonas sp. NPDC079357 TaxID=3364518 RepID=UPI00384EE7E9
MGSLGRLTALFLGAFGAATALTGYASYSASRHTIEALVDRRLDEVSRALLDESLRGNPSAILSRIAALSSQRETGDLGFELVDARGQRLGGNVTVSGPVPAGFSTLGDSVLPGTTAFRIQRRDAGGGLRLVTLVEIEPVEGFAAVWLRSYAFGFGLIVIIVVAGAVSFSTIVRRRIGELRRTAEAIIDGDLTQRVPVEPGGGAFAGQAVTFNRMLDRIAALVESLRHVGGDVAHDLRTPLARLRSRLALIVAETPTAELEAALEQCDEMLAMFSAILRISEVEGGERRTAFRAFALAEVASEVAETLSASAEDSGHILTLAAVEDGEIEGDRQLLTQATLNLVGNALTHSPPGTRVTVAVTRVAARMLLTVMDDGPGIPAAERATALRRFGRLDASRHCPGHGLGLPLVEAIARMHGGTLVLDDAKPGLRATIAVPVAG